MMLFAPLRIFLSLGLMSIAAGLGYGIFVAMWRGQGLSVLAASATLGGALSVVLGLIADQISQIRLSQIYDRATYQDHLKVPEQMEKMGGD